MINIGLKIYINTYTLHIVYHNIKNKINRKRLTYEKICDKLSIVINLIWLKFLFMVGNYNGFGFGLVLTFTIWFLTIRRKKHSNFKFKHW